LTKWADGKVDLPASADVAQINLDPLEVQCIGQLCGQPCYAAGLPDGLNLPEPMSLSGLRGLFGLFEETLFQLAGLALQIVIWDQAHRFCGRCGHPLIGSSSERAKTCRQCRLVVYPRINPCIIVAVVKGKRILLARRNQAPNSLYSVLAGYVDAGETLEACLHREVKEEVDLKVRHLRYFGSQPWPYSSALMVAFTAEYASGAIRTDGDEILDADWYSADHLPRVPGWGSIARQLIDAFVKGRGSFTEAP
jgi:NAD+ diphosphatase